MQALGIGVAELAVILIFGIPIIAIVGGIFLSALKILKGQSSKEGKKVSADETRIMQEIYQGLSDLEKRVESLETLLLDRARSERERWKAD